MVIFGAEELPVEVFDSRTERLQFHCFTLCWGVGVFLFRINQRTEFELLKGCCFEGVCAIPGIFLHEQQLEDTVHQPVTVDDGEQAPEDEQ